MAEIVGVRFCKSGKIYHFDPAGMALKLGDSVVVDTANGPGLGRAVVFTTTEAAGELSEPLKSVVRLATADDIKASAGLCFREAQALDETRRMVTRLGLPMKLISAEYNLDASHLTVFFSAEGRVDFRELVREISHNLKVRVELRQVGPRDETKLLGGFGRCGREHCCATFLDEFSPVSIKMAKVQDLPLNPMKISGVCGRLLCCLGYECEQYREIKERMPREGQRVMTDAGPGMVVGHNTLEEKLLVEYETGVRLEVAADKIKIIERVSEHRPQPASAPAVQTAPPSKSDMAAEPAGTKVETAEQAVSSAVDKVDRKNPEPLADKPHDEMEASPPQAINMSETRQQSQNEQETESPDKDNGSAA